MVLDRRVIQPYGCTNAGDAAPASHHRPGPRRSRRPDPAGHPAPRHGRPGRRGGAGVALRDELRGGAEAHRDPRGRRARLEAAERAPEGRADGDGGAPGRPAPARPVRGVVARPHRSHDPPHRSHEGDRRMTVTAVRKDPVNLTLTLTAEFDATPERVWELWSDRRQLERWWGPPMYPATFTRHDLAVGSRVNYYMTGPEGDQPHGYWDI